MPDGNGMRPMLIADCEAVADLDRVCLRECWEADTFRKSLACAENYYIVYEANHRIVGFAGLQVSVDTADVLTIGVDPAYRRKSIGHRLLTCLLKKAKECGCERVLLEVRESNVPACKLYEKFGFHEIAIRKAYYNNPKEDARILQYDCGVQNFCG